MHKFWFEEIDIEELKSKPTAYLLKLRNECYAQNMDYYNLEQEKTYETFFTFQKAIYEILATREHYPNKLERKAIRQEKARLRKVGH